MHGLTRHSQQRDHIVLPSRSHLRLTLSSNPQSGGRLPFGCICIISSTFPFTIGTHLWHWRWRWKNRSPGRNSSWAATSATTSLLEIQVEFKQQGIKKKTEPYWEVSGAAQSPASAAHSPPWVACSQPGVPHACAAGYWHRPCGLHTWKAGSGPSGAQRPWLKTAPNWQRFGSGMGWKCHQKVMHSHPQSCHSIWWKAMPENPALAGRWYTNKAHWPGQLSYTTATTAGPPSSRPWCHWPPGHSSSRHQWVGLSLSWVRQNFHNTWQLQPFILIKHAKHPILDPFI